MRHLKIARQDLLRDVVS